MELGAMLRQVDGWPHVLLGPPALALSRILGDAVGVDAWALAAFIAVFTLYGFVVLHGTREETVASWMVPVALGANLGFVLVVALSLALSDVTAAGAVLHVVMIGSGIAVIATIRSRAGGSLT